MNTQERNLLEQLLKQLTEFKLAGKDNEAEGMIREAVARQPDAAYLLAQRVLLLEHAVSTAQARITDLQKQLQNAQSSPAAGFLGNDPWAQPAATSGPVPGTAGYQPSRYAQPAAQPPAGGLFGGGSSFLGNVATTAAGVVAGSFLFQGIENLMGHHSAFGQGGFGQQPFGEQISEETVINNYYGDDAGQYADNGDFGGSSFVSDDDGFQDDFGDSDWT